MELKDTVPPHNLEAERATLGALLLDWSAVPTVVEYLRADRFYSLQHQVIFAAMTELFTAGVRGDVLTLTDSLTKSGRINEAGGTGYIASLTDTVPTSANVEYYAKIVLDNSTRRELIKIAGEVKASAFDETKESRLILEEAEQKIFSLTDLNQSTSIRTMQELVPQTVSILASRQQNHGSLTGIGSGLKDLDDMTSGFQKSELIIIGARPSMGKTALALTMIQNITMESREKHAAGFFSLEMSAEQIGQRLFSMVGRIPGHKFRSNMISLQDLQKVQDAAGRIYEAPLYIVDTPNMKLLDLRAMARRMCANRKVDIIFIDYMGLISTENTSAPVFEQQSEVSKSLKSLARELNIPIVALCQLAREAEGTEPTLSQLRGSGSIEQDADVVMFIHRSRKEQAQGEEEQPYKQTKLIVAKQRNGPIGDVNLMFIPSLTRFESAARSDE